MMAIVELVDHLSYVFHLLCQLTVLHRCLIGNERIFERAYHDVLVLIFEQMGVREFVDLLEK